jgi:hypothetical protein
MVASVDRLQYLELDFGERIKKSVKKPLVRIATDLRARVGFVCAWVVDEFRVNRSKDEGEVAPIERRVSLSYRTRQHRSAQSRVVWQSCPRRSQPSSKRRKADDDPFIQGPVSPRFRYERDADTAHGLHVLLRHRPPSISRSGCPALGASRPDESRGGGGFARDDQ